MKKILFLLVIAMVAVGCKTKQVMSTANEVEVLVPCAEFKTDKTAMRATATAVSPNLQNAKDKAIAAARRELATMLGASVQRVLEAFASSYDMDEAASFAGHTKDFLTAKFYCHISMVRHFPISAGRFSHFIAEDKTTYNSLICYLARQILCMTCKTCCLIHIIRRCECF